MKNKYIVLLLTVVLFVLIPCFINIFWSAADDPRYIFMVSGAYTGIPAGSLLYVGSLYGRFLAFLYGVTTKIEWYSLVYYLLFIIAIIIFVRKLFNIAISKKIKYIGWLILCITHIYMAISPQSTFLAADLSIASIALLYKYENKKEIITALGVFFVATQLRLFGALMPYLIAFPIFFLDGDVSFKNIKKYIAPFGLCILLSVVTYGVDAIKYNSTSEWKAFKKFDAARCYIADNPLSNQLIDYAKTREDKLSYELFQKYRIYDTDIMTVDKMVSYASLMKTYRFKNIKNNASSYKNFYMSFGLAWVVFFIICGVISLKNNKEDRKVLLLLSVIVLFILANLFMMAQSEAKERALMGALFSLCFAVMVIVGKNMKTLGVCILIFACGMGFQFARHIKQSYSCIPAKMEYLEETEAMLGSVPYKKVYMPIPTCIDPEAFHSSCSPIAHKTIIQGWMQIFPESNPKYRHLTAFAEGLPILVRKDAREQIFIIKELLAIHYGINTKVNTLNSSKKYELIQFKKMPK